MKAVYVVASKNLIVKVFLFLNDTILFNLNIYAIEDGLANRTIKINYLNVGKLCRFFG